MYIAVLVSHITPQSLSRIQIINQPPCNKPSKILITQSGFILFNMLPFANLFQFRVAVHWTHPSCVFTFLKDLTLFYHLLTSTGHIDAHYDAIIEPKSLTLSWKTKLWAVPLSLSNHESIYGVASHFCLSSFLICVVSYFSGHDADYCGLFTAVSVCKLLLFDSFPAECAEEISHRWTLRWWNNSFHAINLLHHFLDKAKHSTQETSLKTLYRKNERHLTVCLGVPDALKGVKLLDRFIFIMKLL